MPTKKKSHNKLILIGGFPYLLPLIIPSKDKSGPSSPDAESGCCFALLLVVAVLAAIIVGIFI